VECRRQRPATSQRTKKKAKAKAESSVAALSLPNIAHLIGDGEITIGMLRPVGCVATAADEDCNYAMLVRRRGESLFRLLTRLEPGYRQGAHPGIFTDEINH
jgi:hypothetical protein